MEARGTLKGDAGCLERDILCTVKPCALVTIFCCCWAALVWRKDLWSWTVVLEVAAKIAAFSVGETGRRKPPESEFGKVVSQPTVRRMLKVNAPDTMRLHVCVRALKDVLWCLMLRRSFAF